ncbi:hypothetical protein [Acinetobacter lanii]|uniref:Uncharacterized protein n=1 Tax=Acinetobacter lanii TaxID=2715163 RepID=A0A6G8S250_9GAMM|nr:hypothetical protein [Acinetobacter lanii]QIO08170.1 hypothetical protein G8D99_03435 [Acinetobacter lanii]
MDKTECIEAFSGFKDPTTDLQNLNMERAMLRIQNTPNLSLFRTDYLE